MRRMELVCSPDAVRGLIGSTGVTQGEQRGRKGERLAARRDGTSHIHSLCDHRGKLVAMSSTNFAVMVIYYMYMISGRLRPHPCPRCRLSQ